MTLDEEDLRTIDAVVRAGTASAIRMQAAALRSTASMMAAEARTLDDVADGIENGTVEPPAAGVPLKIVPVDDEPQPATDEPDEPHVEFMAPDGAKIGDDGELLSTAMVAWLDEFDDRIRRTVFFVAAVNEAAEAGLPLNHHTAQLVAARVRELGEKS